MLRRIGIFSVAVLMVVGTAEVYAQGFQGRGFGGFGGARTRSFTSLLRVEEVQTELEMTESQKEELSDILTARDFGGFGRQRGEDGEQGQRRQRGEDGERRPRGERDNGEVQVQDGNNQEEGGRRRFQDLTDEDRARLQEEAAQREREQEDKIAEVLEEAQLARLIGIYIQVNGANSLTHRWVAERLELSGQQEEQITKAREESQETISAQLREAFQDGGDREAAFARIGELREKADEETMMVLTGAQREHYESMKGDEFDMPEPRGFGGGGRGFGGGRPGGDDGGNDGGDRPRRPQRPGSDDAV